MRDPKPLAPWIAVGSRSAGSTQPTWQRLLLAPHAKTYPPRPKLRHSLVHPARAVPHGRAQGFEVELGSRGRSGGTDRAGMSKCCPGLDRLAAMRALASRPEAPDSPAIERGWNCPVSFVGPPAAAKIRPVRCDRAALPQTKQQVPGGYAALCLDIGKLRAATLRG